MASTTRTVALPDGESTTLETWGTAGPILLCIHGIGSSRASWKRTADALAGTYRVAAYDQRGHGDSAKLWGPMTHDQSVADCVAVADALGEPIRALVGHSWGGAIALLAGPKVATAAVVAIDPLIHQRPGTWHADYVADLEPLLHIPPAERVAAIRAAFAGLPPVEIDAKVHALREMSVRPVVRLGEQNRADMGLWDLRVDLRRYPLPLLLLLADAAESVVLEEDLWIINETLGPNATIEVFEGEGHALHRTAFDRYVRSLTAFLA
jgi:pimeloyl-ACP methyl ester carboxylesterase